MTVRARVVPGVPGPEWYYAYYAEPDFLAAICRDYQGYWHTLQGSYDLIMDMDDEGALADIEALAGPRHWRVRDDLQMPDAVPGQAHVIEDVDDGQRQAYFTDPGYTLFYARLGEACSSQEAQHVAIAPQVVLDVDCEGVLTGVWLLHLPREIAVARGVSQLHEIPKMDEHGDVEPGRTV